MTWTLQSGLEALKEDVRQTGRTSVLKDAGLVAEHAEGTRRIYHLNEAGLTALRDQLDTFWNRALSNYQHVIEDSTKEKS